MPYPSYPYDAGEYPYPEQPWDLYVRDWDAKGDGSNDDTQEIQNALDAAASYDGGIVFFPPGTYVISGTIKLPSKVYMKGVAGTTYNAIENRNTFLPTSTNPGKVNTVIKLKSGLSSAISMLEPKTPNDFSSAGIENIIFDGNEGGVTGSGYFGIKIVDASSDQRSQAQFRNIIIYQVRGIGFYGGARQHELFLDWVTAFGCTAGGFTFRGEDIKGNRLAAGGNGGVGIQFPGSGIQGVASGSCRFSDVDCWGNTKGIEITDSGGYVFFGLVVNLNTQYGLKIFSTTFAPFGISIFRGSFSNNSKDTNTYSDVELAGSPYDIVFIGCEFHGDSDSTKPQYAIKDSSTYPKRCIVSGGYINRGGYGSGFSNKPQAIKDCFDYTTGDLLSEAELHYGWVAGNYTLGLGDGFVGIDASATQRTVTLPSISAMSVGRIFYVAKTDGTANNVIIQAQSGQTINGTSSVSLSGQRQAYMIIHAGSEWLGIKIA